MAEILERAAGASLLPDGRTQSDWSEVRMLVDLGSRYFRSFLIYEVDMRSMINCQQFKVVKGVGLGILNYSPSAGLFDRHVLASPCSSD